MPPKPKYNQQENPRTITSIRLKTLQELKTLYPQENTNQKIIQKLIEEIKQWRNKT